MANRTDPLAKAVHGTNPQNLIENIVRQKIYEQMFWKEDCFALTAETLVEKAIELRCVGGTYGGTRKASKFLCLILKLLQLQPEKEIVYELIKNDDFKYVTLLGAFYLRLVGGAKEVYNLLEPLYQDYRKIRVVNADGTFSLTHVDEAVEQMLTEDFMFDTALPFLPTKGVLVSAGQLKPRVSPLQEQFDKAQAVRDDERRAKQSEKAEEKVGQDEGREASTSRDGEGLPMAREDPNSNYRGSSKDKRGSHDVERGASRNDDKEGRSDRGRDRERHRDRERSHHHSHKRDDRDSGRSGRRTREEVPKASDGGASGMDKESLEIAEANALRASLGLKPLK